MRGRLFRAPPHPTCAPYKHTGFPLPPPNPLWPLRHMCLKELITSMNEWPPTSRICTLTDHSGLSLRKETWDRRCAGQWRQASGSSVSPALGYPVLVLSEPSEGGAGGLGDWSPVQPSCRPRCWGRDMEEEGLVTAASVVPDRAAPAPTLFPQCPGRAGGEKQSVAGLDGGRTT